MNKNEELFEKFFKKQLKNYPVLVSNKDKNNMRSAYIAGILEGCRMMDNICINRLKDLNKKYE